MSEKCPKCGEGARIWVTPRELQCFVCKQAWDVDETDELRNQLAAMTARAEAAEEENGLKLDCFQSDVASALGWGECEGHPWIQWIRGYRMAHAIERAENAKLRARTRIHVPTGPLGPLGTPKAAKEKSDER